MGTRGRRPLARAAAAPARAAAAGGSALLLVFVISLFIPGSLPLGPVNLSLYQMVLMASFVPLGYVWIRGGAGGIVAPDLLMLAFCLWAALSILVAHGPSRIVFIGTNFVEFFGAYLAGRVLVRGAADYRALFRYIVGCLVALLPLALVESLLGKRLLLDIVGKVLVVDYPRFERRLGLARVSLGFAHSIHLGVICSLAVANVYYLHRDRFLRSLRVTGFVLFMLFLALSSGPMLSAAVQIAMIGWDRTLRFIRGHWMIGVFVGVVTLAVLQLALTGGLVGYMVNEVIFSSYAGNNRIAIWQYGSAEVLRHPLFGIGLGDWRRPFWQNATVDNFWLLIAMRHGLPAFVFLALAIAVSSARIMRQPGLDLEETRCRTGYLVALTGLVISLATVHVWQAAVVFVTTYIGAGVWFYTGRAAARDTRHWRVRAAADAAPAGPRARPAPATAPGAARKPARQPPAPPRRARPVTVRRRGPRATDDDPPRSR